MAQIHLNIKKEAFVPKHFPLLLDYSHRWELFRGSAGSGKSYSICQKIIIRCCREPIRVVVCRRTGATLRQSCFSLFKEVLGKWQLLPHVKIRETDMNIQFPNGSEIIMIGLDDEMKLLSLNNISCFWIEEAFEVPKSLVEQINLRMRGSASQQQIILSFNPISSHHWLYDFCMNPPNSFIENHSTYRDNPFLPKEYVEALDEMETRDPQRYRVYGRGEWGIDSTGLIYQNWRVEDFDHTQIKGDLMCGLDYGFVNDISAFCASLMVEEEKRIYIFKEWGATNKTNADLVKIITDLGFNKSVIIADSSEPKSIAEMKAAGIQKIKPATKGPDSVLHGIQKLQNYQIIIHPSCTGVICEFENYTWQKDKHTDVYINKPVDAHNHYLDSLRYSLQCVGTKLKTFDKNLL
jgi:phage terminase large subunit